ncbi:glycoside hydrolase family 97 protein [candidate division KSB1 bacterium]|nr:glycoside hydrolase family 97 protein [candidate division KSB1 bacterium]RQW06020.1 MAG: glycoside hydrolase family 97 protein [candidate division KSB1 bacterium]
MKKLFVILAAIFLFTCQSVQTPLTVSSPDGTVQVVFNLSEGGVAHYSVLYKDQVILSESPLALEFEQSGEWGSNLVAKVEQHRSIDEEYELIVGKTKHAVNRCNEMLVKLAETNGAGRQVHLVFRAYDDGAAFRYVFPQQRALKDFAIIAEKTEFRFPQNHACWAMPLGRFTSNYEKEFERTSIDDIAPDAIVGLPLTIEIENGPVLCLTEANLTDYAGMYLNGAEQDNALVAALSPWPGEDVCVKASTPFVSPWRVLMIGDTAGDLIESNIILNLNEPLAIENLSWIKAGKVAWDWWSGQVVDDPAITSGMNNETMQHYIDFAAENGLEYMLIDAGWYGSHRDREADITQTIPEIDMPGLVTYANDKGVDILIWLNWRAVAKQMDEAFVLYEQWGVKGVKIDYMDRDDQEMINFYHKAIKKAAEHHLTVDFHGAYKPTGIRRTWPNLMTREGILGLEYLKWSDRATPEHNVTIPFTRMVAGPMDYTPGGFRNVTPAEFQSQGKNPMVPTTRCHQLAMYVVFESPLQMLSDAPANYRGQDGLDFLRLVPATWENTRVLTGKIGDYVAIARQSGDQWFIGAMTDADARTLELPLDFLGEGEYKVTMWSDGPGADRVPTRVTRAQANVTGQDVVLQAVMAPGGGFVAVVKAVK